MASQQLHPRRRTDKSRWHYQASHGTREHLLTYPTTGPPSHLAVPSHCFIKGLPRSLVFHLLLLATSTLVDMFLSRPRSLGPVPPVGRHIKAAIPILKPSMGILHPTPTNPV
ncbi:hypothetical protein MCOR16_009096 [Pyricularia oryzae]|nr:hypothetical protein MCOR16_009096 [Pyricularia oryzae]